MGYNDIKLNPLNTHKTFPTSCQEVLLSGNQLNGFYLINKGGGQSITLVTTFCDFTKPQFDQGDKSSTAKINCMIQMYFIINYPFSSLLL